MATSAIEVAGAHMQAHLTNQGHGASLSPEEKNTKEPPVEEDQDKETSDKVTEKPNPKIFDNKTYVEAPLPKTNPWSKSKQKSQKPGECKAFVGK